MIQRSRSGDGRGRSLQRLNLVMSPALDDLAHEQRQIHSLIEERERFLREAPHQERHRRLERRVTVPPDDDFDPQTDEALRRLTRLEERALSGDRRRHALLSAGLATLLIGLLTWLARILQS